jgi:hypothetical protein
MQTEIYSNSRCIKIVLDGRLVAVNKQQIKTMNTLDGDKVQIDIGEGPLKQIYLRASEVTIPSTFASSAELLDTLVDFWVKGLDCCADTKAKMDRQITELVNINAVLLDIRAGLNPVSPPADIFAAPLQTDNEQPGVVYEGFAAQGTTLESAGWAIRQTVNQNNQTVQLWSNGTKSLDNIWIDRANISYLPLIVTV